MLTVYLKPTCSGCQALVALLEDRGIEFEGIDYYVERLSPERLAELAREAGVGARGILRTRDRPELDGSDHTDAELFALIAEDPDLVLRPIVERGDRAVVARPPERALELVDGD
ncbi:MAG TPA: ArsC/Spx/MgsR family protein [Solirubrobacteraceae bacterium]|nr:ArsC/Spx/MgsR family protein [Solirubrobacteraceae bacterium]